MWISICHSEFFSDNQHMSRAAWYFACDSYAHIVLWWAVNLHHLLSDEAAFNAQSPRSLISYAISRPLSHAILIENLHSLLVIWLCVFNAAPFENSWWRFTANQRTVFTDEMRITIAGKISCSPKPVHIKSCSIEHFMITHFNSVKLQSAPETTVHTAGTLNPPAWICLS